LHKLSAKSVSRGVCEKTSDKCGQQSHLANKNIYESEQDDS